MDDFEEDSKILIADIIHMFNEYADTMNRVFFYGCIGDIDKFLVENKDKEIDKLEQLKDISNILTMMSALEDKLLENIEDLEG